MERYVKVLAHAALAMVIIHGKAHADDIQYTEKPYVDRPMYLGISAEHSYVGLRENYKKYLKRWYPGADVFLGWRINECYGIDFGYSWTIRETKGVNLAVGESVAETATASVATHVDTSVLFKNTHLDANYYIPVSDYMDTIFSAGVGFVREKILTTVNPTTSNVYNMFNISGRTNMVPRLGIGLDGMITDNWGMRAMLRYQIMNSAVLRDNGGVLGSKAFRGNGAVSLGVYRHFTP